MKQDHTVPCRSNYDALIKALATIASAAPNALAAHGASAADRLLEARRIARAALAKAGA